MQFLSSRSPRTSSHPLPTRLVTAALAASLVLLLAAGASAQIKEPGNHPDYSVELEPHAFWRWAFAPGWASDGFGLGARATIPIIQDGPIKTINNSMGIGFGLDWMHYSGGCWGYYGYYNWGPATPIGRYDCTANSLLIPGRDAVELLAHQGHQRVRRARPRYRARLVPRLSAVWRRILRPTAHRRGPASTSSSRAARASCSATWSG